MDKKTFIKELEQALSVLQEEELEDIISEYEQHIDMKKERGLTEEEAIADFGSLDELASEILEAYHVRADYGAEKKYRRKFLEKKPEAAWGREKSGNAGLFTPVLAGMKRLGEMLLSVSRFWQQWGIRIGKKLAKFARDGRKQAFLYKEEAVIERGREDIGKETGREEDSGGRRRRKTADSGRLLGILFHRTVNLAKAIIAFCLRILGWGIRMIWNAGCIGFALFCGFLGLFCLYGFGLLIVLLFQGYPLVGVTLGCLGLVMCTFSAAWLGLTLLWRVRENTEASQCRYQEPEGEQHA